MIAEKGKTYAQIRHSRCHWIFTSDELPEWNNDHCPAVDVTENVPAIGDIWNGAGFEAPPPPPPPSPEQQALLDAKAEAKADNVVQYLRDHTPAECEAYVQTNVTDLASAKALLKKFAIVLCVLSKQNLR